MTQSVEERLCMSATGVRQAIGPGDPNERAYHESLIRADYDRFHSDDSFEDLKHRARFSKWDQGLLRDWMAVAAQRRQKEGLAEIGPRAIAA